VTRHRFAPSSVTDLCAEAFGGVARCSLPRENTVHWTDADHPFTVSEALDTCGWRLQDKDVAGNRCGFGRHSAIHDVEQAPARTEYPAAQPEVVIGKSGVQQRYGYPPDEDAVPAAPIQLTFDLLATPQEPSQEQDAVACLRGGERVMAGPWPVRQYRLADAGWSLVGADGSPMADDQEAYEQVVTSLDTLGETYSVLVTRPLGQAYRMALVTWGAMRGESAEDCAEQIALDYDIP
jgi:hypothetical protein